MRLSKNGHVVETSLNTEAVRLISEGYEPVTESPAPTHDAPALESPKPSPKSSK